MIWTIVAILALPFAVWRLSSILISEDGPFDLLAKLRSILGVRYDENSVAYGTNTLATLFTCIWCISIWVSTGLTVLLFLWPQMGAFVNMALAGSAFAILIEEKING